MIERLRSGILALLAISLLTSCSTLNSAAGGNSEQDALAALQRSFLAGGLHIEVEADAALNRFDDASHTLVLAVMQSRESLPYYQLLDDPARLTSALLGQAPPPGALQFRRFAIRPGQTQLIVLDRFEAAQYIGLYAAYYSGPFAQNARLLQFPVSLTRSGWVARSYSAQIPPALIRLKLGPQQLQQADIQPRPASTTNAKGSPDTRPPPSVIRLDDLPPAP